MKLVFSEGSAKVRGPGLDETSSITLIDNPIAVGGSSYTETISGIEYFTVEGQSTENAARLLSNRPVSIENLTPATLSVDGDLLRRVSDGLATIRTNDGMTEKVVSHNMSVSTGSTVRTPTGYQAGTLAKHIQDQFGLLNLPLEPSASDIDLITNNTQGYPVIKNASNFASSNFDDSGIGYQNTSPYTHCYAAISPRHVISAGHTFPGSVDIPLQFVDTNGVVHQRIANRIYPSPDYDIGVGYLTQALPPEVTPLKILPADFDTKLNIVPIASGGSNICVNVIVYSNTLTKVGIRKLTFNSLYSAASPSYNVCRMSKDTTLSDSYHNSAASSSMVLTVVNGELVLLTSYWAQEYDWQQLIGSCYSKYIAEINSAMASAHGSSEYQLQTVDLTGFPAY